MSFRVLRSSLSRFLADRRGATSAVMTLMIVPLVGAIGMAIEGGSWYLVHRAAQNAADAASVAAAINACTPGDPCDATALSATYVEEAAAVSSEFGFVEDDTTDIATTKVNCPGTTSPDCYQVLITKRLPLSLVRLVGFSGDAMIGGQPAQTVRAVAIARPRGDSKGFCMFGLDATPGHEALRINGGPNVDLSGCDLFSNSNLVCNGANSDTGVVYGYAVGTSQCGATRVNSATALDDPFDDLKNHIPAGSCTAAQIAAGTTITAGWTGTKVACGNTTISPSSGTSVDITTANAVLKVHQGSLNLNGKTLRTTGSGTLSIVFTGTAVGPPTAMVNHIVTGSGTLDIAAPTDLSNALHGVAIMQDKNLVPGARNNLDMAYTGNNPTLNIQGLIYLPRGDLDIRGAINLKSGGLNCLGVVAQTILVSGQGAIFENATSDCLDAGLYLPAIPGTGFREALVQ